MDTNVEQNQLQTINESPQSLITLAINKGASIEQLEKLMAMKERYDAQMANKTFLSAIANFQKDVPEITKSKQVGYTNKTGGFTGYKFAELGQIDATIKDVMAANGLSKRWEITEDGERIICTCIISHFDGHFEKTTMSSIKDASGGKNEIQSRASAVSYLQRYTLIGALGLTTASEDNDGDGTPPASSSNTHQAHQTQQQNTNDLPWLNMANKQGEPTSEWLQIVIDLTAGDTNISQLRNKYKISKITAEAIEKIKVVGTNSQPAVPITQSNDEPFVIPGLWYAKMEKCKTKADVLAIYNNSKETIDAHPELQKLLRETSNKLSTK
jgi:hypothetical protein